MSNHDLLGKWSKNVSPSLHEIGCRSVHPGQSAYITNDFINCEDENTTVSTMFWKNWQCIVTDHCQKDLTQPTDKLPAIAGLAKRFWEISPIPNNQYLAGLWKYTLLHDVLWARKALDSWHVAVTHLTERSPLRAPSWSRASVDGSVRWLFANDKIQNFCTRVVSYSVIPRDPGNAFGEVAPHALLTLSGPLWRVPDQLKRKMFYGHLSFVAPPPPHSTGSETSFSTYLDKKCSTTRLENPNVRGKVFSFFSLPHCTL